jgi:hypothetical protein
MLCGVTVLQQASDHKGQLSVLKAINVKPGNDIIWIESNDNKMQYHWA